MNEFVELRNTPGKGEGIFALRAFNPGQIVLKGKIKEFLTENHSHASQISATQHVLHDGLVPKVNHSCNPNCGIKVNETGAHDFVAMKNIEIDDEITFDYAMRNYSIDHFHMTCQCGSKNCRKQITGWKDLPQSIKNKYEGFIAPYLLELDRKNSL